MQTTRQQVRPSMVGVRCRTVALGDRVAERHDAIGAGGSGRGAATVEVGSILVSDPVDLEIAPLSDLAVDLYLPDDLSATMSPATVHGSAWATSYVSRRGNYAGVAQLPVDTTIQSWLYLARVDVLACAQRLSASTNESPACLSSECSSGLKCSTPFGINE